MKCKVCGKETNRKIHIRNGYICENCHENLPIGVKEEINKYTSREITNIKFIIGKAGSLSWIEYEGIKICDKSIQINDWEIELKDINNLRLNFHPEKKGPQKGLVNGSICVVIETKHPHLVIEESIANTFVNYRIAGRQIIYMYPKRLQEIMNEIQKAINSSCFNTKEIKNKILWNQGNGTASFSDKKFENSGYGKIKKSNKGNEDQLEKSEFEQAKEMFGIEFPYTEHDIRKKRNELIKMNHPDVHSGDEAEKMCREINKNFELLMKFAKKMR